MDCHCPAVFLTADQPAAPLAAVRRTGDLLEMNFTLGLHRAGGEAVGQQGGPMSQTGCGHGRTNRPPVEHQRKQQKQDAEDQTDLSGGNRQLHGSVTSWAVNW